MSKETNKLNSALSFEKRVTNAFEALGYHAQKLLELPEADLFLSKFEFPLKIRLLAELKYYERSLVPASTVYRVLNNLQHYDVDKATIVTTLGFTREAIRIAEESKEKVILLTEAELVGNIPRKHMGRYYDAFVNSDYVDSSIQEFFEVAKPRYEYVTLRLSKSALFELLAEFTSHKEIARFAVEKIPQRILIKQLTGILKPTEIKEILAELPKKSAKAIPRKKEIEEKYKKAKNASDSNEKGKLLEQVMKDIFGSVPGLKIVGSRIDDGIEEIDIQIRNYNHEHVWAEFDGMIFVECKNWSSPIGPKEIDSFKAKLERNGIHSGILVATTGVTGQPRKLEGSWGAIKMHLQKGYKIVVLEGRDLGDIFQCTDVSEKVDEKYVYLFKLGSQHA